jgi:NAD(P)-dependent dehydrogenase (short-subunit alcohol dehydrogenase family)
VPNARRADAPRTVFITGASSGIGAALAARYAALGANVGAFARRAAELDRLVLADANGRVAPRRDIRDASLARAAADFVPLRRPGPVIANAGISQGTLTEHAADLPVFRAVLETNVQGMVHTFQPFLAAMKAARRGTLAGIASVAGFRGLPGAGAYSASKAAAITYLESLRIELRGSGIAVVTICPGYVATPMTAGNPYRMPFLLNADRAARLIARAIERRHRFYTLPWQMALVGCVLRVLPPLYDMLFAHAPRKPGTPTDRPPAANKRPPWRAFAAVRDLRARAAQRRRIPTVIAQ